MSVSVVRAQKRDVAVQIEATGTVSALATVDVKPQIASVLTEVHVREGQFVAKGQPLFTLDGRADAAKADLERAIRLLADAVLTVRREQPRGFVQTALMDANAAVARYRALGGTDHALPQQLVALLDTDIRIVMEWNTPRTDLDLWVTQPNGEEVGFSYRLSATGGRLTADVTNGYGPEEFLLRQAAPGTYTIRANTFASDRSNPNGPSGLSVRIIRNFGRPNQTEEQMDVEMRTADRGSRQLIGTITIPGPQARPRRR